MRAAARLSFLDRYLTAWILLAMLVGIGIGYAFPNAPALIQRFEVGTTNVPLAIGPLVEVPALLALVHVAFALGKRLYNSDTKRASLIA